MSQSVRLACWMEKNMDRKVIIQAKKVRKQDQNPKSVLSQRHLNCISLQLNHHNRCIQMNNSYHCSVNFSPSSSTIPGGG